MSKYLTLGARFALVAVLHTFVLSFGAAAQAAQSMIELSAHVSQKSNTTNRVDVTETTDQSIDSAEYILGTRDQLSVRVFGADELSEKPVEVGSDGKINLPMVGKVQASGVSVRGIEKDLSNKYSTYFKDPQVTVSVVDYRSEPVTVVGAVNTPNVIQLHGPTRLMHVISLAGGLRADAGDRVMVTRQLPQNKSQGLAGGSNEPNANFYLKEIDLLKIIDGTDPSADLIIQANDLITVPKAKMVYVVGDVGRPGGYVLDGHSSTLTVLQVIALAGGINKTAAMGDAKILRTTSGNDANRVESQIDMKKIMASKAPDIPLHANDILFVPNSVAKTASLRALEMAINVGTGIAIWHF